MYSLYIPKFQGDKSEFLITKVISSFAYNSKEINSFLFSPGYLSIKDTTIREFVDNFCNLLPCYRDYSFCLFNGMNGCNLIFGKTILDCHNDLFKSKGFYKLDIELSNKKDHRKMIFFIKDKYFNCSKIEKSNIESYINRITIEGIMIGSSNQSQNTYFSEFASKGEADLLMFKDKGYADYLRSHLDLNSNDYINSIDANFKGCVLSESIAGCKDANEYFKSILENFLINTLK